MTYKRKGGWAEALYVVTTLALVFEGRGNKLPLVNVGVAADA